MNQIFKDLQATHKAIRAEQEARERIMSSEEYQTLESQINALQDKQAEMLSVVPDSTEEYELDKIAAKEFMIENKIKEVHGFIVSTRKKKYIDVYKTLCALGGDIDALMLVTSIKQKDLETFVKDNPEYKKDLKECIIECGFSIVDIYPQDDE